MTDVEKSVSGRSHNKGMSTPLVLTILGIVMGSLQFGYNIGSVNTPEYLIKSFMNETNHKRNGNVISKEVIRHIWALTVSIYAIGGCFGSILAGWVATKLGRKRACLVNILIGAVASALVFSSKFVDSVEMIIIGRIIIGFHSGLNTGLSPLYLSEISTPKIRGSVGVLHQRAIGTGIFIGQVLGFPDILGTEDRWNFLLGFSIVPCLLQGLILPFCPESPRYLLINKGDEKESREALVILRGTSDVEEEINEIKQEKSSCTEQMSIVQLLRTKSLRIPILIGVVMHLSQQFSGANGVSFYSTSLFKEAGFSEVNAKYTTCAVGGIQMAMSFVTAPLIDRVGRRTLHCTGCGGMAIFSLMVTISLVLRHQINGLEIGSIVFVLTYMVFFAVGPGPIPWLIVAELFSHDARPAAISICVFVNWLSSFAVGFIFPSLKAVLKDYTFLPFTVLLILFFVFTFFCVPETKGKTFEEVSAIWKKKKADMSSSSLTELADSFRYEKSAKYGSTNAALEDASVLSDRREEVSNISSSLYKLIDSVHAQNFPINQSTDADLTPSESDAHEKKEDS